MPFPTTGNECSFHQTDFCTSVIKGAISLISGEKYLPKRKYLLTSSPFDTRTRPIQPIERKDS